MPDKRHSDAAQRTDFGTGSFHHQTQKKREKIMYLGLGGLILLIILLWVFLR